MNTVSVVVNGMVGKGILERRTAPGDRRRAIISLTDYALSLKDKYDAVSQQMNALFYQGFAEEERLQFEQSLSKILDTLTQAESATKQTFHQ